MTRTFFLWIGSLAAVACFSCARAESTCAADLEEIAAFMPVNDAGAEAALRHHAAEIASALQTARQQARDAADDQQCGALLNTYLHAWRRGHLSLAPWPWTTESSLAAQGKTERDPFISTLKVLGKQTVLLTFPTFYDSYRNDIAQLLEKNRKTLERHPYWIIDVRRNNGGSDGTYAPLQPWLMSGGSVSHNVAWLSTAANLKAQEDICSLAIDRATCEKMFAPLVATLRETPAGQYAVPKERQPVSYDMPAKLEKHAPRQVAVLIDHGCGSSCEQFLLDVRQSRRVKLLGRPTSGELDVSNLRPHVLPSGTRALFYATSRSLRLPAMPIDDIGVQPDILLPVTPPEQEVLRVQRWLEGGSLE